MARSIRKLLLGSSALWLACTAAIAQDDEPVFDLGTITLFGDRTADSLEDSTASVGIVDEDALDSPNNQSLEDTFRRLGNVLPQATSNNGFVIRGVNSEGLVPGGGSSPVASLYIDGIQQSVQGVRQGALGLFDTEQVEVFRGPQSTLTGRNALAGAIFIRTKDPEFDAGGRLQLTVGENGREQVGMVITGPLNDRLAYRLTGEWSTRDSGLVFPTYAGFPRVERLDKEQYYQVRGKLLWLPTGSEDTRVLLTLSQSFDSPATQAVQGRIAPNRGDVFPANPDFQEIRYSEVTNMGLEISHVFDSSLKFTSQTGYSHTFTDRGSVNLGVPAPAAFTAGFFDDELTTQEFRLNFEGDRVRWVAGIYGAIEQTRSVRNSVFAIGPFLFPSGNNIKNVQNNIALFGEVAYEFSPGWTVIAGGRLDYFDAESTGVITGLGPATPVNQTFSDTQFIPKLGISYDIAETQTLSFVYQQGYRPGGSFLRTDLGIVQDFDPEQSNNFELNYRGSLLDGTLVISASAFYQQWRDQQVQTNLRVPPPVGFVSITNNAGRSESYGAEIEVTYAATSQLELFTSIGLLETKFKTLSLPTMPLTVLNGSSFPSAPNTNIAIGADWQSPQGWFAGGVVQFVGSQLAPLGNAIPPGAVPRLGEYVTVDVQAGYAFRNGAAITVYANNLFDETYFTSINFANDFGSIGPRREVGVRLDYEF